MSFMHFPRSVIDSISRNRAIFFSSLIDILFHLLQQKQEIKKLKIVYDEFCGFSFQMADASSANLSELLSFISSFPPSFLTFFPLLFFFHRSFLPLLVSSFVRFFPCIFVPSFVSSLAHGLFLILPSFVPMLFFLCFLLFCSFIRSFLLSWFFGFLRFRKRKK